MYVPRMEMMIRTFAVLALLACGPILKGAQLELKTAESTPQEISDSIRALLQPKAAQLVRDGKPVLEVWLRKEVPTKSAPTSVRSIAETTLVGAVAVRSDEFRDYKDNQIPQGVYVARFVMQPQDGDHLGTADYSTFLALLPATVDKEPGTFDRYQPMVKASGRITPSGHPVVLSLRPASSGEAKAPALVEPEQEHKAIRLKVPAKGGDQSGELTFDLVYEGHGHIQ